MKKEMLINVLQPEECRIAILEDGVLEELYVERTSHESYVGNIYKGRIVNIEPSIQAAFVDFGVGRNGFLHVSDVEPAYYRHLMDTRRDEGGRGRRRSPPRFAEDVAVAPESRSRQEPAEDTAMAPSPEPLAEETFPEAAFEPPCDQGERTVGDQDLGAEKDTGLAKAESVAGDNGNEPADAEPSRNRRRHRGKSRRNGGETEPATSEKEGGEPATAVPEASAAQEIPPAAPPLDPEPLPPRSRLMDSAEHRTGENDPAFPPLSELTDDDLSFSRPQSQPLPPPVVASPPPPPPQFEEEPEPEPQPESLDLDDLPFAAHEEMDEDLSEPPLGLSIVEEEDADFDEEAELPPPRSGRGGRGERGDRGGRGDRGDRGGRGRNDRPRRGGPRSFARPGAGRPKPLIQDIFKRGQEVLVQVIKEGIGTKGPTLSTYISIAGRYLVLMPGLNRIGVSRKITDEESRRRLREVLHELKPPKGLGFIIRTAGLDRNKKELQRDLAYLARLWQVVVRRIRKSKTPAEIYQESDMITRTIRDTFTSEIDTIWVDEKAAFEHAQEFLQIVMPRYANRIKLYDNPEPMFHKYGIETEIARIHQRHVPLPNGGSIVIEQTEALVAIDVNSGNFRADNNAEETAYQMNLLAAKEIARQLRLRDLGGVIVNDFIDMREEKHRRGVERAMRDAIKRDRARTKVLKISAFGIIEMTRQRIRPSLKRSVYQDCPHCLGTGQVKTCESMSIDVMRLLQLAAHRTNIQRVEVRVHADVAHYLLNRKRKEIARLEENGQIQMFVNGQPGASPELLEFMCYDNNNNEVKFLPFDEPVSHRRRVSARSSG